MAPFFPTYDLAADVTTSRVFSRRFAVRLGIRIHLILQTISVRATPLIMGRSYFTDTADVRFTGKAGTTSLRSA